MRALAYIKAHHSRSVYEDTLLHCFRAVWENNENLAEISILREFLSRVFSSSDEVELILAASESTEWKDALASNTKYALAKGAYGAPWFLITNKQGVEEPFFGSDRWAFMWRFLGLTWRDVEVENLSKTAKL